MAAVVYAIAALHTANTYRHKRTVVIPIHRVVGLPRKAAIVVGVIDAHIHARGIKALQYKARTIHGATGSSRVGLDITCTDILIVALDKSVNTIISRGVDRNARRRHIG